LQTIFYNGKVMTSEFIDSKGHIKHEAVSVKDGLIAAVGSSEDILAMKAEQTELIDLKGRSLLPGFNDCHLHLTGHALTRTKVDLRCCTSLDELVEAIKVFIRANNLQGGEWVLGWGWDQSLFADKKMPTRQELDRAAPNNPVSLMRTCCHINAVNSIALQKAGIDRSPLEVEGGTVEVDSQGVPTGILEENAMKLVTGLLPPFDKEKLKELITIATKDFAAAGLTSVQTDDLAFLGGELAPILVEAYRELETSGELPVRINLQALLQTEKELQAFIDQGFQTGTGSDMFKIGPLKLLTDGSIGGRTALLSSPYSDKPDLFGVSVLTEDELQTLVTLGHSSGLQVAAHAIGDAAIGMVLDSYEKALKNCPADDPRFRVIHSSIVSDELLKRYKEQNVIADIQPLFVPSDFDLVDRHLGSERAHWTYRWKDIIDSGIAVGCGSDCPVESYEPLQTVYAAVTRQDKNGNPPEGWFPGQRLTLDEVLYIYTMGSAYCSFEENIKGSITPGKLADLVVLSEDISSVEPARILELQVDLTMVGGKVVYRS